jgi:3-oxoacyl-[acyl-carrier protein] reductase
MFSRFMTGEMIAGSPGTCNASDVERRPAGPDGRRVHKWTHGGTGGAREGSDVSDFTGRRVLVTGGSRGIGRATATAFAAAGAAVGYNYSRAEDETEANETSDALRAYGGAVFATRSDVADATDVTRLFEAFRDALGGPVEVLVNNAAVSHDAPLMLHKESDWDRVIDTNLKGAYLCSRAALRGMIAARTGRIVSVASPAAFVGQEGAASYAASKGGLVALTKSLAREVARFGITVNAVSPGLVDTRLVAELRAARRREIESHIPLGRLGTPEEVAAVILFVSSPAASYMTGSTLHVDGGLTMR